MVELLLSTGDTRDHGRIEIRGDWAVGYEVKGDITVSDEIESIYPLNSVVEINPGGDEIRDFPSAQEKGMTIGALEEEET